jgi:hypothetical protein
LNRDAWTPEEDAILSQQQRIHGNAWVQIAQCLPGRCANSAKNRWSWILRRTESQAQAGPVPDQRLSPPPFPPIPTFNMRGEAPKLPAPPPLELPAFDFPSMIAMKLTDEPGYGRQLDELWSTFEEWCRF